MSTTARHDAWSAGEHYERYMGRWSRQIAARYLDWLGAPKDAAWLDLGCGTGALTQTILARAEPRSIVAIDQSADFVAHARAATSDEHVRMRFEVGMRRRSRSTMPRWTWRPRPSSSISCRTASQRCAR